MSELRWILLAVGVLFIIGLTLWERRRAASRQDAGSTHGTHGRDDTRAVQGQVRREPPLDSDGASAVAASGDDDLPLPPMRSREPERPLPVIELRDDDADARAAFDAAADAAVDGGTSVVPPATDSRLLVGDEGVLGPPRVLTAEDASAAGLSQAAPVELKLTWPPESERRIVAIRVVATGERLSGRAVRQALTAEGLAHGPMSIFHRARDDGRVLWSATSLTKPGSFELASMDSQRYSGLQLFAVLPGVQSDEEIFDDLRDTARRLASRLGAEVRDAGGQPVTDGEAGRRQ